jgi:hypothetical protein
MSKNGHFDTFFLPGNLPGKLISKVLAAGDKITPLTGSKNEAKITKNILFHTLKIFSN